jgi:hypothetical protein
MRVQCLIPAIVTALLGGGGLMAGCDRGDDDDSGAPVDDDDSAASDDDTAGDDDTAHGMHGGGSADVTGAPACGQMRSVLWIDNQGGFTQLTGIFASTESLTCARYNAWDDAIAAADAVFQPAYDAAVDVRDPVAACGAVTAYYEALVAIEDELWPMGTCSLQLRPDDDLPGDYEVGEGWPEGMSGKLVYPTGSYYGAALADLGACTQYNEWDGVWTVAQAEAATAAEAARDVWNLASGLMDIVVLEDQQLGANAAEMTLEQETGGGMGTLSFNLEIVECVL